MFDVFFESTKRAWVKLADIATYFEKKSVLEFERSFNQQLMLVVLGYQLSITRVSSQVDG
jgi:hypothetical protein